MEKVSPVDLAPTDKRTRAAPTSAIEKIVKLSPDLERKQHKQRLRTLFGLHAEFRQKMDEKIFTLPSTHTHHDQPLLDVLLGRDVEFGPMDALGAGKKDRPEYML